MEQNLKHEIVELRARVNYLEKILEMLPGHIYWHDCNGVFLGCNLEQAKSVGLSSVQQMIGTTPYDHLEKSEAVKIVETNAKIIARGKPHILEEQATYIDGTVKTFISHKLPLKDDTGNAIGLLGVSLDITRQKQLEKELMLAKQGAETTLNNIIAVMPGHVYWKDKHGKYLGCNNEFAKLLKLPEPKAIIGKTDHDLLPKTMADIITSNDINIIDRETEITLEELGEDSKGNPAFYLTRKTPLRDMTGAVVGIVGVSIDITERKKMELALIEAKENISQLNKIKSDFLSAMSISLTEALESLPEIIAQIMDYQSKTNGGELLDELEELAEVMENINALIKLLDKVRSLANVKNDEEIILKSVIKDVHLFFHSIIGLLGLIVRLNRKLYR